MEQGPEVFLAPKAVCCQPRTHCMMTHTQKENLSKILKRQDFSSSVQLDQGAVDDKRKAGWQWQGLCPLQSQVAPTIASVMVFRELAHNVGIPVMALAPKRDTGEEVDCFLLPFSGSNQKTDISKPKRDTEPNRPFIWDLAASQTMGNPCV